jgi:two-component system, NarL family, sensor kinase
MVSQVLVNDTFVLISSTLAMITTVLMLIIFAFLFQRKLLKKQTAYREIEKLLQKEELRSAYALLEGKELERKRIAEDLHDNIGSILATLRMYSDLIFEKQQDTELKRLSEKVSELTEQAAAETRRISHHLDSGVINNFGLKTAIEQLSVAIMQAHGLLIKTAMDISPNLNSDLSLNIYRVIQELFNNVLKHAQATQVRLDITQVDQEYLSIIFQDNGKGFRVSASPSGIGLQNIKTRTERFKGTLTIESSPEKGTTVIIEIPLE